MGHFYDGLGAGGSEGEVRGVAVYGDFAAATMVGLDAFGGPVYRIMVKSLMDEVNFRL